MKPISSAEKSLLSKVRRSANALASHIPLTTNLRGAGKLYEAWLMLEIGLVLRRGGWKVIWSDPACFVASTNPAFIIFRGAPAPMCPATYRNPPGFLVAKKGDLIFEVHNSVQYRGRSDSLHEIDISIIRSDFAQKVRVKGGAPRGLPPVALELKNYTSAGFHIGIVRQMLMVAFDLAAFAQVFKKGYAAMGWWNPPGFFRPLLSRWAYVAAVTSATDIGKSDGLAGHYGSNIWKDLKPKPRGAPGSHPEVVKLVRQAVKFMRP